MYHIAQAEDVSFEDIIDFLKKKQHSTAWASATIGFAVHDTTELNRHSDARWQHGLLSREDFESILLPEHKHSIGNLDVPSIFPLRASIEQALSALEANSTGQTNISERAQECMQGIVALKEAIVRDGFTTEIILTVSGGQLLHVDGLHRILALALALKEGYTYAPIPVFLHTSA